MINEGGSFNVWIRGMLIGIKMVNVFYEVFVVNDMMVFVIKSMGIINIIGRYLLMMLVINMLVLRFFKLLFNVSDKSIIVISGSSLFIFLKLIFIVCWWVKCLWISKRL